MWASAARDELYGENAAPRRSVRRSFIHRELVMYMVNHGGGGTRILADSWRVKFICKF